MGGFGAEYERVLTAGFAGLNSVFVARTYEVAQKLRALDSAGFACLALRSTEPLGFPPAGAGASVRDRTCHNTRVTRADGA